MIKLKNEPEVQVTEEGVFSFPLVIEQDGKEITGQRNITAEVKQTTANILTPQVKLNKNAVVQFQEPEEHVILYVTIKDEPEPILIEFDFAEESDVEEIEPLNDAEESVENNKLEEHTDPLEENQQVTSDTEEKEPVDVSGYPILTNTTNVEFDFIFTSQIKEILSGNIESKNAKEIYDRAINTKNKIVFYRDTNTNTYYWISEDKILSAFNFTELLLAVNEYLTRGE